MAVLYLLSPGSSVRKDAGRLIIEKEGTIISRMPIFMLTSIVVGMRANITTPALFACMEERVPVFFIDHKGRTVGQIAGEAMTFRMLRLCVPRAGGARRDCRVWDGCPHQFLSSDGRAEEQSCVRSHGAVSFRYHRSFCSAAFTQEVFDT